MKIYKYLLLFLCLFTATSIYAQTDVSVNIDAEPDLDLSEYDSYFWVTDFESNDDVWITVNSMQGQMIKQAVEYEMDINDMQKDPENADLLVNFHIFDSSFDENFYVGTAPFEYRYMEKQATMEDIDDGTIVVSLIDKEKGVAVWEGYATIDTEEENGLQDQRAAIRKGVSSIFDRYGTTDNLDQRRTNY